MVTHNIAITTDEAELLMGILRRSYGQRRLIDSSSAKKISLLIDSLDVIVNWELFEKAKENLKSLEELLERN